MSARERVEAFLAARSKPGLHDPEVIYVVNERELRTSDLRMILVGATEAEQWREEYEGLRDAVIEHLNPRDGDDGELFIMVEAIEHAASVLNGMPCSCPDDAGPPDWNGETCPRCSALGRARNVRIDR